MSEKTVRAIAITLLVVVAITAAGGIAYFLQQRRIDVLEAELQQQGARLEDLLETNQALTAQSEQPSAVAPESPATPESAQGGIAEPDAPETPKARQFAFVAKATRSGDTYNLTLDYAQFLTGDAAAQAAAAEGGESPPPNDYYISNENPKLRALPVSPNAKFTIAQSGPDETRILSAAQFADAITANTDGAGDAPYWFTIEAGVVTGGEEQWTP